MELLKKTNVDFVGKRYFFYGVSGFFILLGIVSIILRGGPNYGIDFVGGLLIQIGFDKPVEMVALRSTLNEAGITGTELQSSGNSVILRVKHQNIDSDAFAAKVIDVLSQKYMEFKPVIERKEFVGPTVGRHLAKQAYLAVVFSMLGIIVYVAFRFHSGLWGTAGVVALFHDVFITFGLFSVLNKEITVTVVAALLTLAGYSINDTIVIFDRIRDNLRFYTKETFYKILNDSINQTLSRTVITSFTVFIVVIGLFLFGGEVIHDFAFALLIGVIIGSYSTIFIASPLIYEWEIFKKKRMQKIATLKYKK
ncbi:MAG: protein translocase subunit SecF [Elusimicrobia bacterium]|nr:protein translocase subunit SecF [Candidatus Liberimonas magnetica]